MYPTTPLGCQVRGVRDNREGDRAAQGKHQREEVDRQEGKSDTVDDAVFQWLLLLMLLLCCVPLTRLSAVSSSLYYLSSIHTHAGKKNFAKPILVDGLQDHLQNVFCADLAFYYRPGSWVEEICDEVWVRVGPFPRAVLLFSALLFSVVLCCVVCVVLCCVVLCCVVLCCVVLCCVVLCWRRLCVCFART
jgi:hypothetical protein